MWKKVTKSDKLYYVILIARIFFIVIQEHIVEKFSC